MVPLVRTIGEVSHDYSHHSSHARTHTHTNVLIFKRSHKKLTGSAVLVAISDAAASRSPRNVVYLYVARDGVACIWHATRT